MLKSYNKEDLITDLTSDDLVYLYFHLPGCKPCKRISPLVEQYGNNVDTIIYKLQIEDDPELIRSLQVRVYPTMVGVKKEKTLFIAEGADQILEKLI